MNADSPTNPPTEGGCHAQWGRGPAGHGTLAILLGTLLLLVGLRIWLTARIAFAPGQETESATLVFLRTLDAYTGWAALLILSLVGCHAQRGRGPGRHASRVRNALIPLSLLAGILALTASIFLSDVVTRSQLEIALAFWLALCGLFLIIRQLVALAAHFSTGLNIEQLWRLIAAQWILVWLAAEIFLRIKLRGEGVTANESARNILFLLPTACVLPNILMALGIRWWIALRPATPPQPAPHVRAWLLAMLLLNLGAVLLMIPLPWLGIPGAALMIAATLLYLAGFRRPGLWTTLAWTSFILALLLLAGQRLMQLHDTPIRNVYSAAWRYLLTDGLLLTWLLSRGLHHLRTHLAPNLQMRTLTRLIAFLLILGILTTLLTLLAAISHSDALPYLLYGTIPEAAALLLATAVTLRTTHLLRHSKIEN